MADSTGYPAAHSDEGQLFRDFNDALLRKITRAVVYARPELVEDACAYAWTKFLQCQPDRDGSWEGWLFRTAQRQAWALQREAQDRSDRPVLPLRDDLVSSSEQLPEAQAELRAEAREALAAIAKLPPRLRRIAELRTAGFTYDEISQITGSSRTKVAQLATRANEEIAEIRADQAATRGQTPARAERLWELERRTPDWLAEKIGRPVKVRRKFGGETVRRRAWRRAALALDDYRTAAGANEFEAMTSEPPADPALRGPHATAVKAMGELEAEIKRQRDCSRGR
jgi:RNA polymerase sigma factor (sigma-70 family)